jgi:hypothetical protein
LGERTKDVKGRSTVGVAGEKSILKVYRDIHSMWMYVSRASMLVDNALN